MKIGIDCRLWNETGIGRYIRNLILNLQELDKKNEHVLFVLCKDEKNIKSLIHNSKFIIRVADIKWHSLEEQIGFPQILNKENLDLMHFPYFSVPIVYNRPFVITIHDLIMHHFSTGQASTLPFPIYNLKRLAYRFVLSIVAKNAKKIIAVSNATKNEIVDHLKINPRKIEVIHEGVENSKLKTQKSKLQLKAQKYFLYVGNAYPHKNLDRLLEAFKIINSEAKLVLVGKDDYFYKRLLSKVREMNLSEKVILFCNVSDDELATLYQNAKALILPSLMEGFGLPALEAMANNCLVLASDIPALHEVCGDAAIYFDPHNINDLAEKLKRTLSENNNEKKKKGLEMSKFFSWRKMAKETLKVYENSVSL